MLRRKTTVFVCLAALLVVLPITGAAKEQPKNIILMIGDGMGIAQITAAKTVAKSLAMEKFKTVGLVTTHPLDGYVTDSAAAGTALATGHKTHNRMISQLPNGETLETILEKAEHCGKRTGLVVTCAVTEATPAVFYAHVDDRYHFYDIAQQLVPSGVDVVFGGGWNSLALTPDGKKKQRGNSMPNWAILQKAGYTTVSNRLNFRNLKNEKKVVGLFAAEHMPKAKMRLPSLSDMTSKAIALLDQGDRGFFLMVEGSQIDWGGHENNLEYVIDETVDFDKAVGAALEFVNKDKQTLLVVTADHETGGLALLDQSEKSDNVIDVSFATKNHSASMVPLFATGPGSARFGGIQDNAEVGSKLKALVH